MLIAVFIIFRILFRILFNFESFTGIQYTELNLRLFFYKIFNFLEILK